MPDYWQVTKARAEQTLGVWELDPGFTVQGKTRADFLNIMAGYPIRIDAIEAKKTAYSAVADPQRDRLETLRMCCVRGAGKMSADLDDDDPLDRDLGRRVFSIDPDDSEADLIKRCKAFESIWTAYDARLGAQTPPAAFLIRGVALAGFSGHLAGYEAALGGIETARTQLTEARTSMENFNRLVDRTVKAWYRMWKDEYPEGSAQGDALRSQVEPEEGQQRPGKLEIDALVNIAGLKVRVEFTPGGGERATVRLLQVKVVGVDDAFRTVRELTPAEAAASVEIGPFALGQQVIVRTDVGNSRDTSEVSAERSIVIA